MSSLIDDEQWQPHHGGDCPVKPKDEVYVRYRNGVVSPTITARERRWVSWPADIGESEWDIVAWQRAPTGSAEE